MFNHALGADAPKSGAPLNANVGRWASISWNEIMKLSAVALMVVYWPSSMVALAAEWVPIAKNDEDGGLL
jgi:hypothetical protein